MTEQDYGKPAREPRKERVLHTRVPAVLEQELKRVANAWRVPVSNVVRALLEDALDTLDVVGARAEDELRVVAEKLATERHKIRQRSEEQRTEHVPEAPSDAGEPLRGAVGATPITLVHDTVCGITGETLPAGTDAYLVLFDDPGRKLITGKNSWPHGSTNNEEKSDD